MGGKQGKDSSGLGIARGVTLCGHRVPCRHVCAFVSSMDEQYRILNPYFHEGIESGEEVLTIVESGFHGEHLERMRNGGVAVDPALESEQLRVVASEDTYLLGGMFVVDRMYMLLEEQLRNAAKGPRGRLRVYGDAVWILRNLQTTDELMAYEAKVNLLASQYDCTLLCVYDINECSGQVVADALATHSHVILGERVHENPFFVEPLEFLKSVALRRPRPAPIQAPTT